MPRYIIPAGTGFDVGADFARAVADIELSDVAPVDGHPRLVRAWIPARPDSKLGFMRRGDSKGRIWITCDRAHIRTTEER